MAFITKEDLGQDIYDEILSGLTRDDDSKIDNACAEAQDEVTGYLCARYDTENLFLKEGAARNKTVLSICRTIAIYNLHSVCNTMTELRRVEYEDAIKLLDKIQSGRFILAGSKLAGETDTEIPTTQISRSGNPPRANYY